MSIGKTSGERATSVVAGFIRHVPALVFCFATTACAHTSSGSPTPTTPPKEPAAMNAPTAGVNRPHTLDEFPELTPEEIGRRFLKLIDSLKSIDQLTPARVREVMQLPMVDTPETHGGFFTMSLPESGWKYSFSYSIDAEHSRYTNAKFELHDEKDNRTGMTPVCGVDFNAYVKDLKIMGFVEREDLAQYESPMPLAIYDAEGRQTGFTERQSFRLPGYIFTRSDLNVLIVERPEAAAPDVKLHHLCVESISVGGGK